MTFGHALASPPNRLRIRFSGLGGELRALVKNSKVSSGLAIYATGYFPLFFETIINIA
jgi:hypothetical protein